MVKAVSRLEVVAIGEELLTGATVDTNAAYIARQLEPLGIRIVRKTTVGDDPDVITDAVRSALERTGAVITTGGLGPTKDDATKAAVAEVFGRELEFRPELWETLSQRYAPGHRMPETNRSQAEVPKGAQTFPNPRGTAPGIALEVDRRLCILLPGVPGELEAIMEGSVIEFLSARTAAAGRARPFRRQLRTAGIAEAEIAAKVGDRLDDLPIEVAYLPEVDGVDIRLTRWSEREDEARDVLEQAAARVREILGHTVYAEGGADMAQVVGDLLRANRITVVTAESCTGGLIATRLTERAGASDYFWGSLIVYDDQAKVALAGVPAETLRRHGAVSEETARALAEGACARSGVPASIAVTGIAGPTGGSEQKPVGTVWLAARLGDETVAERRHYAGTRDMVRSRSAQGGLDLLRRLILRGDS